MSVIKNFTDLETWQIAHSLRIKVLKEIHNYPSEYAFGLSSQTQRSAISIGSNIAEGFGRKTAKEKLRFYDIARGSLTELQDQLLTARDVGIISEAKFEKLTELSVRCHKMIHGLMRSIRTTNSEPRDTNGKA